MSYVENINLKDGDGNSVNPSTQELQELLLRLLDRLEYGMLVDTSKRLKVVPEQPTAANLNATVVVGSGTVTTVTTLTNQTRIGDIQAQRMVEALLDASFINGITNNISFT